MAALGEETQRLKEALRERETALTRQEGENFLLHAQVKQLQQQVLENGRDAAACVAQLGQALQLLESGLAMRTPLKQEVDRARVLVAGARRSLRRSAGTPGGGGGGSEAHTPFVASIGGAQETDARAPGLKPLGALAARAGHRRSAPRGRDRSWGAQIVASLSPSAVLGAGPAPQRSSASGRSPAAPPTPAEEATPRGGEEAPGLRGASSSAPSLAAAHRRRSRGALSPRTASDAANGHSVGEAGGTRATPSNGSRGENLGDALANAPLKATFLKQRELLVGVLRKFAGMEAEVETLRDDVTRRDVIIHSLRQEVQQHQAQQLQQLQQLQELQGLVQQRAHEAVQPFIVDDQSPGLSPAFAEREAFGETG